MKCFVTMALVSTLVTLSAVTTAYAKGLVYESYVNNNWELFRVDAPGSEPQNLTKSSDRNEMYPQVSPDGTHVCFIEESGAGRDAVRAIHVMKLDGTDRKQVAEYARQPCWSADGKTIAFLPQEFKKFNIADYFTKGISFYDVASGTTRAHVNSAKLHHLYNPCYSSNGKWIAATVHAGMGFSHANLLIEVDGARVIDLGIQGCRPCLSPTGKQIAWGETDHTIIVADLDVDMETPKVGERRLTIQDRKNKVYHVDWAPDGRRVSFSRGPDGNGDLSKPATHQAACEMVGVHASGWDIYEVKLADGPLVDFEAGGGEKSVRWTTNGMSNKESDWVP